MSRTWRWGLACSTLLSLYACTASVPINTTLTGMATAPHHAPVLNSFTANPLNTTTPSGTITFSTDAVSPDGLALQFTWSTTGGTLSTTSGRSVVWTPPSQPGSYTVSLVISDGAGGVVVGNQNLTVKADLTTETQGNPSITRPEPVATPATGGGNSSASNASNPASSVSSFLKFTNIPLAIPGAIDMQALDFNRVYAVGGNQVTYTTDAGRNWTTVKVGTNSLYKVFFIDASNGWVAGAGGVLFHTVDGGNNWTLVDSGTSEPIWDIAFSDPENGFIFSFKDSHMVLYKTSDGGKTWGTNPVLQFPDDYSSFERGLGGDLDLGYYNHYAQPSLFLDASNRVWFNAFHANLSSLFYYHDGAFENVLGVGKTLPVPVSNRLYLLIWGDNGLAKVGYTEDNQQLVMLGADFKSPSQIQRNLGLTNLVQVGNTIRAFTKTTSGEYSYLDSTDSGATWTDPAPVGQIPYYIKAFDLTHYWGYQGGNLYRAGL